MDSSLGGDATPAANAAAAPDTQTTAAFAGRAADHRKQVFDERRARYDEAWHAKAQAEDGSTPVALNRAAQAPAGEHH
jgi:hypothetical protein